MSAELKLDKQGPSPPKSRCTPGCPYVIERNGQPSFFLKAPQKEEAERTSPRTWCWLFATVPWEEEHKWHIREHRTQLTPLWRWKGSFKQFSVSFNQKYYGLIFVCLYLELSLLNLWPKRIVKNIYISFCNSLSFMRISPWHFPLFYLGTFGFSQKDYISWY